jgi:hypothetical protein
VNFLPLPDLAALPRRLELFNVPPALPIEAMESGLCPPLLVSRGALVWGHGIVDAARGDGSISLPVDELALEPGRELLAALVREGRTGRYEASEEWAIAREAARLSDPEGRGAYLDSVSLLLRGDRALGGLLARLAALSPCRARAVESGLLDLKTAERCRSLPEACAEAFLGIAPRLSASERRIAFGFLDDIFLSGRLDAGEVTAAIGDAGKEEKPLEPLRRLRYPELASMEAAFGAIAARELGGSGVRLEAPRNFEGSGFALSFEFTSRESLARRLAAAAKLEGDCDELFSLLR